MGRSIDDFKEGGFPLLKNKFLKIWEIVAVSIGIVSFSI